MKYGSITEIVFGISVFQMIVQILDHVGLKSLLIINTSFFYEHKSSLNLGTVQYIGLLAPLVIIGPSYRVKY